jgi:paraquat-inducible protein B
MTDLPPQDPKAGPAEDLDEARPHRRRFSLIWIIPIVAAMVAAYLGYNTYASRGPLVSVIFPNADGLTAGQTQVRYKSVAVGTVESIHLSDDLARVTARIRMMANVEPRLTRTARFWVVRPRLTAGNISGLETIVSGAYIEFDPGAPDAPEQREFTGLADPPGIRSDEPGRIFILKARRLGSIGRGSQVFFRDIAVGEILSFDPPGLDGSVTLRAFIRQPYEGYLRGGSRFWNTSGIGVSFGPGGVKLELESVRAVVAGGIAFDTPPRLRDTPPVPDGAEFQLHESLDAAISATSEDRLEFLVYFDGSVRGLERGAPVEMRGIRIGSVSRVALEFDKNSEKFRVPVRIAVEPDRISFPTGRPTREVRDAVERMVADGLRAQLRSGNLLTGQKVVALDFIPGAPPASVGMQDDTVVLPSLGGDSDDIMATVSAIAGKLERLPLDEIGQNLNNALASVTGLIGGPELHGAVVALSGALGQVQGLVQKTDNGLTPLLRRLPTIASNLEQTIARANTAVGSIESGYGRNSDFNRQLDRLLAQASDTARSIRLLADYLDRHPEALLRGRTP